MVEHTAVNRGVVGSSPTRGVKCHKGHLGYYGAGLNIKHKSNLAPWSSG